MPTPVRTELAPKQDNGEGGYFQVNIGILNYGGFKYDSGEVVEVPDQDLTRFNTPGAPPKFERISKQEFQKLAADHDIEPAVKEEPKETNSAYARQDLQKMNFNELKDIISGIDDVEVLTTDKKSDLIAKILKG